MFRNITGEVNMKRCMYCGHENEDSLVSCSVCGNRLGDAVLTQEPVIIDAGEASESPKDGSMPVSEPELKTEGTEESPKADEANGAPADNAPSESVQAESATVDGAQEEGNVPQKAQSAEDEAQSAEDEAMVTQEPAFAGQIPVNSQFGETTPAGQFTGTENTYAAPDMTPGYGEDWRQDVGRGQTYGARTQYEARREARRAQAASQREGVAGGTYNGNGQYGAPQRDQYGSAGYGYRQPGGQEPQMQGQRADYGRRESAGGSKVFMVRARKRVKSVTFCLMAIAFTAMLALNAYNIYCGNALRNITESESMLANILSGTGTNFFTQMLTELASQLVKMVVNVQGIISQLGKTVELGIAVVFLVPNVLYAFALWLMFFRTDTRRRQFPMGGYTLARVMMILKFLIACLVLAIGLVISVYFVVVGAQRKSGSIDSSLIQGVILLIVMIVLSVFVVMYYIQWMFCLKVVKDNAKKGTDPGRMPGFVVFLSLLCTAACVLLMIPMAPNDYIGLASRGAAAVFFLVSGLWVLIYKIKVKRA